MQWTFSLLAIIALTGCAAHLPTCVEEDAAYLKHMESCMSGS